MAEHRSGLVVPTREQPQVKTMNVPEMVTLAEMRQQSLARAPLAGAPAHGEPVAPQPFAGPARFAPTPPPKRTF
jgi:hypothetical protein